MSLLSFCQWLQNTPGGISIRESTWTFPILVALHLLSLGLFFGTVAMVDLRLLGGGVRNAPVSDLVEHLLPLTRSAFAVMAVSGGLLIWAEAVKCYNSPAFRIKMVLILLAGINVLVFHLRTYRTVAAWDWDVILPRRVRLAGSLSLLLWLGAIVAGRAVGYNF